MKVVILAGGFGTRISEESAVRPKPMVEIGGRPILWHIMKIYSHYGIDDFVIAAGYKGSVIKDYIADYALHSSDVTFDMRTGTIEKHRSAAEPWRVTIVDTGEESLTGGRIRRVRDFLGDETFCCTYGDGVSDVDIGAAISFHREQRVLATMTAVQPPGRFGVFTLGPADYKVSEFHEKPSGDGIHDRRHTHRDDAADRRQAPRIRATSWVNGGFFVLEPAVIDYIDSDTTTFEREPMERLAREGQLAAFRHSGFWQPMDTLRDRNVLEELWKSGAAPWKVWA